MTLPKWSAGRTHEYLRPYWNGHTFLAIYLHHRGYSYRAIAKAIGVCPQRVCTMVAIAKNIIKGVDERGYARERTEKIRQLLLDAGIEP